MNNFNNKIKKRICPFCGGDHRSYKLGHFIRNSAIKIRKRDKQADVLIVYISLRNYNGNPQNFACLMYNPCD